MTNTTFDHAPRHTARGSFLAPIRAVWAWLRRAHQIRVTINALHQLNDHTLRDIGLERHHIDAAVRDRISR